jgi:hypothetical protein
MMRGAFQSERANITYEAVERREMRANAIWVFDAVLEFDLVVSRRSITRLILSRYK